jgi:hypothetical protein
VQLEVLEAPALVERFLALWGFKPPLDVLFGVEPVERRPFVLHPGTGRNNSAPLKSANCCSVSVRRSCQARKASSSAGSTGCATTMVIRSAS